MAVLPFELFDLESRDAYLANGFSTELLTALGKVDGVRVLGHESSSLFKSGQRDVKTIGQRLDADVLVLAGVRRDREQIHVYIEVVDALSGEQIWAHHYKHPADDIFEMQALIADGRH